MKSLLVFVAVIIFSLPLMAQEPALPEPEKRKNFLFSPHKNEFGVNTAPIIGFLISTNVHNRYELWYKRRFERFSIRAGVMFVRTDRRDFDVYDYQLNTPSLNWNGDSYSTDKFYSNYYGAKAGFEWNFNLNRVQFFVGADLIGGFRESKGKNQHFLGPSPQEAANGFVVDKTTSQEAVAGVAPFGGIKVFLAKRLSISAEVGINLNATFGETTLTSKYYSSPGVAPTQLINSASVQSGVEMEVLPLLNNVGLSFTSENQ